MADRRAAVSQRCHAESDERRAVKPETALDLPVYAWALRDSNPRLPPCKGGDPDVDDLG